MIADMSDTVTGMSEPAELIDTVVGTWEKGEFTPFETTPTTMIDVVSWPSTARELEMLPEGMRSSEARTFVSATPLRTADVAGEKPPHRIVYRGITYSLERHADWSGPGNFHVAVGVKVGQ